MIRKRESFNKSSFFIIDIYYLRAQPAAAGYHNFQ
jgi:hypothetical protein